MDVLQWIKEDHQQLRSIVRQIEASSSAPARKKLIDELTKDLSRHLFLESEYLYPEVMDLYTGAEGFVKTGSSTHKAMKKILTEIQQLSAKKPAVPKQSIDEKLLKLSGLIEKHLEEEESQLMPKIRELIPTQDREDLGQVFLDLRDSDSDLARVGGAKRGVAYN